MDKGMIEEALANEDGFFLQPIFDLKLRCLRQYALGKVSTMNNHMFTAVNYDPVLMKLMNDYNFVMIQRWGAVGKIAMTIQKFPFLLRCPLTG